MTGFGGIWSLIAAMAVFFACFVIAAIGFNQYRTLMPFAGLWQRLALIIGLGWLGLLSWRVRSVER